MRSVYQLSQQHILPMTDQVTERALDADELKDSLERALDLMEHYGVRDSMHIILELLRHPLPEEIRVLLHEARDRLYLYLDHDAEEIMREAIDAVAAGCE